MRKKRIRRYKKRNLYEEAHGASQGKKRMVMIFPVVHGKNHILLIALKVFLYAFNALLHSLLNGALLLLQSLSLRVQGKTQKAHE
jgi:hypothetical protein